MGASLGMMFGPWGALIGAAAGGIIGGVSGLIKGSSEQKREQEKTKLHNKIAKFRNGQRLSGEYDNIQLARIAKYVETNDNSHLQTQCTGSMWYHPASTARPGTSAGRVRCPGPNGAYRHPWPFR